MGCPPSEVRNWSHKDVLELYAYDSIDPYGQSRDNWHMAVMASQFAQAHRAKGAKVPSSADYMYRSDRERRDQSDNNFVSFLRSKNGD